MKVKQVKACIALQEWLNCYAEYGAFDRYVLEVEEEYEGDVYIRATFPRYIHTDVLFRVSSTEISVLQGDDHWEPCTTEPAAFWVAVLPFPELDPEHRHEL